MTTLRDQIAKLEIELAESRQGLLAATREARTFAQDFKEKQEDRYSVLQRKFAEVSDERDWLRRQLEDLIGRTIATAPPPPPKFDQYGNRVG